MPYILYFIIASFAWYTILIFISNKKNLNIVTTNTYNDFPTSVLLLMVFAFTKVFLNIQTGFSTLTTNAFPYFLLAFAVPIYALVMKNKIQISKKINRLISFIDIAIFTNIAIISGYKSLIFPAIYLLFEFAFANKIKNFKNREIKFEISYISFYKKLPDADKPKYKELLLKALTVFYFMMIFSMITSKNFGFLYQGIFISVISFMLVKNIHDEKFKSVLEKDSHQKNHKE